MDLKVWGLLSFGKYWQSLSWEAVDAFFQQRVKVAVVSHPPVFGVCICGGGSHSNICVFLLLSCYIMSDSFWPHGLQPPRLPYTSLSLRVCSDSCSVSWSCYLPISSSVTLVSCCPQSFPASGSFPTGAWCYLFFIFSSLTVYDVYHACVNLAIFSCISSLKPLVPLVQNIPQRRLAVLLLDILNCLKGESRHWK